jgi:hypothetical protein
VWVFDLDSRATSFCAGDGTAMPCPCATAGGAKSGCPNAVTSNGASLTSQGTARVASDTLQLLANGTSAGAGVFLQGTQPLGAGLGQPFGDGLLCLNGTLTRLGLTFPITGSAVFPSSGGPTELLSVLGFAAPGSTLHYQYWYRDGSAFCTPATFNLTNGLSVTWK